MAVNKNNKKVCINKKTVLRFLKKNYIPICVALAALIIGITLLSIFLSGGGEDDIDASEAEQSSWGSGLTEGIPAFSEEYVKIDIGESYVAAYYENIKSEKVGEYAELLENKLSIDFSKNKYPYVAKYNDKMIVLHYNVTEMRFSITVTETTDQANN